MGNPFLYATQKEKKFPDSEAYEYIIARNTNGEPEIALRIDYSKINNINDRDKFPNNLEIFIIISLGIYLIFS